MNKVLIILRGLPGSGKSALASILGSLIHALICTADDYHMVDGEYKWKPENVHDAHLRCQRKVESGMENDVKNIIVANTSTTEKEMKPYYELAEKYGYTVFSVIVENRHGGVNEHGVPDETLKKMLERFDIKLI